MMAYSNEDWSDVVEHLEKGIQEFFVEEERCRADCEDDLENSGSSHFSGIITGLCRLLGSCCRSDNNWGGEGGGGCCCFGL